MAIRIGGTGIATLPPQNLYPTALNGAPYDTPTNQLGLAAGDAMYLPAGDLHVSPGGVSMIQWLDPVTGLWRGFGVNRSQGNRFFSNGANMRVANLTGCPVSAIVTNAGSGYTQATATITATTGGSVWQAVVGGALSVSSIVVAGAGYGIAPLVYIAAPPPGGVPATAHTVISGGSVTSVVLDNVGAGYLSAPTVVVLPSQFDPNYGVAQITPASVSLILNASLSGAITAAYPTNNGAPSATAAAPTLTVGGGTGTTATVVAQVLQTIVSASVAAGGGGWGAVATPPAVTTAGGGATGTPAVVNPEIDLSKFRPRVANIAVTASGAGALSTPVVLDGGLFLSAPTPVIIPGGTLPTTLASIAFTMGPASDTITIQPI